MVAACGEDGSDTSGADDTSASDTTPVGDASDTALADTTGPRELACDEIVGCRHDCSGDSACLMGCEQSVSAEASEAFGTLDDCLFAECHIAGGIGLDLNGDCVADAIRGGSCVDEYTACYGPRPEGADASCAVAVACIAAYPDLLPPSNCPGDCTIAADSAGLELLRPVVPCLLESCLSEPNGAVEACMRAVLAGERDECAAEMGACRADDA